jgi:hypothetical protein
MVRRVMIAIPWLLALVAGMVLSVGSVPVLMMVADWYADWHTRTNPPATLAWHSIERLDVDTARVTLMVTRHEDCQMVRVLGYTGVSLRVMRPAEALEREDGRAPQSYPVGITVISRPWILRGIYGNKVAVSAYYDCSDRIVKAPLLIGDVPELP